MIGSENMKENTGKTKYILLGLMARCPQTGYTIKKSIEYEYSHFWQESYGQIYPTLKRLVDDGLAQSIDSPYDTNGRGQKAYTITDAGRLELKNWLSAPPDIEKLRYEILLKVSFGANTDSKTILNHLEDFKGRNEKLIADMDGFLQMFKDPKYEEYQPLYSELTALCGKYLYTSLKDWANEAQKLIIERKTDKNETKNT